MEWFDFIFGVLTTILVFSFYILMKEWIEMLIKNKICEAKEE